MFIRLTLIAWVSLWNNRLSRTSQKSNNKLQNLEKVKVEHTVMESQLFCDVTWQTQLSLSKYHLQKHFFIKFKDVSIYEGNIFLKFQTAIQTSVYLSDYIKNKFKFWPLIVTWQTAETPKHKEVLLEQW